MSSRADLARLLWIALEGPDVDPEADALLRAGAGGVVLFSRNITGAEPLRVLVADLRRRAGRPLRVAIDHEGGHVARIGAPLTRFPSAMAVAATGSEALAEDCARAAAAELAWLGIDVNLAPVLDVAADPRNASVGVRAFSSEPAAVARFGAATVRGIQAAGVAATAKHFPGHGRTAVDPHHALPVVTGGPEELRRTDLPPFRAAIDAGVQLVMATHAAYDGLTDGAPSTLSASVLTDLLRGELGFEGLLLTDAMQMRAVADDHGVAGASAAAIVAGADVAMPLVEQSAALDALEAVAVDGRLAAARVSDALGRADRLDRWLAGRHPTIEQLPAAEHAALALDIARRSLTLRSAGALLPLARGSSVAVIEFATRRPSPIEEREPDAGSVTLASRLDAAGLRMREVRLSGDATTTGRERQAAIEAAAAAELVILATRDAYLYVEDRELVAELCSGAQPTILVALRNPYDLDVLRGTSEAIAAYADVPATLEALADALVAGPGGFPGTLPMRPGLPVEAA
jgi:beta-N-acetylhexosaminidase